jgi:hypothetical protein
MAVGGAGRMPLSRAKAAAEAFRRVPMESGPVKGEPEPGVSGRIHGGKARFLATPLQRDIPPDSQAYQQANWAGNLGRASQAEK